MKARSCADSTPNFFSFSWKTEIDPVSQLASTCKSPFGGFSHSHALLVPHRIPPSFLSPSIRTSIVRYGSNLHFLCSTCRGRPCCVASLECLPTLKLPWSPTRLGTLCRPLPLGWLASCGTAPELCAPPAGSVACAWSSWNAGDIDGISSGTSEARDSTILDTSSHLVAKNTMRGSSNKNLYRSMSFRPKTLTSGTGLMPS
mmetsp:Transcript_37377/g.91968  ORF Transcript_37377/g.91968 Transcript_37377/m.91968 type:complete len:201 (-) Transcript_37377:459-1061(-)